MLIVARLRSPCVVHVVRETREDFAATAQQQQLVPHRHSGENLRHKQKGENIVPPLVMCGGNVSLEHKPDSWAQITGRWSTSNAWSNKRACAGIIPINLLGGYLKPDLAHAAGLRAFSHAWPAQICSLKG